MVSIMKPSLQSAFLILVVLTISSCGKAPNETVSVRGALTFDGEPVPGMQVFFEPEQGRGSSGLTGEDGAFEMYYTRNQKGVQPGAHQVTFDWTPGDESLASKGPPAVVKKLLSHIKKNGPVRVDVSSSQPDLKIALP